MVYYHLSALLLAAFIGLILIGIGFALVIPCMLHMTADIFGLIANPLNIRLFPAYLAVAMTLLYIFSEKTAHMKSKNH